MPLPQRRHTGASGLLIAAAAALVSPILLNLLVPVAPPFSDAVHYVDMAMGRPTPRPFAFRFLAPWLAAHLSAAAHLPLLTGFRVLGGACIAAIVFCLLLPLVQTGESSYTGGLREGFGSRPGVRSAVGVCILLTPMLPGLWIDLLLPDLLHAALTAIYLMLLRARMWVLAGMLLPVMYLARESTVLLVVAAVVVLWRLAGRRVALLQIAGALAGTVVSAFAGAHGTGNQRGLRNTTYLLGKVPHNLLKNILGVRLWTERLDGPPPGYLWTVPPWLHLGSIRQVGVSSIALNLPVHSALMALTTFGIGIAALLLLLEQRQRVWPLLQREPWLLLAAVYGLLSWITAPAQGADVNRLFGYGWPLFLLALPFLLLHLWQRPLRTRAAIALVALHLLLGSTNALIQLTRPHFHIIGVLYGVLPLIASVLLLAAAADLLRPAFAPPAATEP